MRHEVKELKRKAAHHVEYHVQDITPQAPLRMSRPKERTAAGQTQQYTRERADTAMNTPAGREEPTKDPMCDEQDESPQHTANEGARASTQSHMCTE